jgi:hypothetical protein
MGLEVNTLQLKQLRGCKWETGRQVENQLFRRGEKTREKKNKDKDKGVVVYFGGGSVYWKINFGVSFISLRSCQKSERALQKWKERVGSSGGRSNGGTGKEQLRN